MNDTYNAKHRKQIQYKHTKNNVRKQQQQNNKSIYPELKTNKPDDNNVPSAWSSECA